MEKLGIIQGTLSTDFGDLVAYEFFKNLALSALGIFIPIILYDASGSLMIPAIYLLVKASVSLVSAFPIMNFLAGRGFHEGLYLSYAFLVPALLLLRFVEYSFPLMIAVAVLYSLGGSLHREAKKLEFTKDTDSDDREKRSADLTSIPNMGRFLGPLIAGSLSAAFGFNALMTFALAMIGLSLLPLSKLERSREKSSVSIRDAFPREYWNYIPIMVARGVQALAAVALYGLFTYVFIGGSFGSGFVRSLDTLGFVIVAYFSAWISDRFSRRLVIAVGASTAAITYFLRALVSVPLEAFIVAFAGGVAFKLYHIPLFSEFADEADSTSDTEFFALSRICEAFGMMLAAALFLSLIQVDSRMAFQAVFVLAGALTFLLPVFENRF